MHGLYDRLRQKLGIKGQLRASTTVYNVGMNATTSTSRPTVRPPIAVIAALIVGVLVSLLILIGISLGVADLLQANQHADDDRSLLYCIEDSTYQPWLPEAVKKEAVQRCVDQLATTP